MEKPRPPDATLAEQKGEHATETFATINGCERFALPLTGFEMPEEVHFAPRSAVLIDNGCAHCPPRGILHYLATGGGELVHGEGNGEYVNPGDTSAWLHELDRRIAALRSSVDKNNAEMMELNTVIHDQQSRIPLTHEQVLELLVLGRASDHIGVGPNRRLHLLLKTKKIEGGVRGDITWHKHSYTCMQTRCQRQTHVRFVSPDQVPLTTSAPTPFHAPPQPARVGARH